MDMIISIEHGATLLPVNSPVIGGLRSAPTADDGVSGPPLWPDIGLPGRSGLKLLALGAALTPSLPEPPSSRKASNAKHEAPHKYDTKPPVKVQAAKAEAAPRDAATDDLSYDEAVEKLLWYLVVG